MGKIYIYSDTHFSHKNIIRYCNRPFTKVEEMDDLILRNWRETIKADDTLFHLGDVFFKWPKEKVQNIFATLPGYKILIMGNHDREHDPTWWREVGFNEVYPYPIIYKTWYILSHEEVFLSPAMPYINIHGHHHQRTLSSTCYINVSVEQTNYKPILLDPLLSRNKVRGKFKTN